MSKVAMSNVVMTNAKHQDSVESGLYTYVY